MLERKNQNKCSFKNAAFFDAASSPEWIEILRSSIQISDKTLIPGEYGAIVAQGAVACGKKKEACSLKMLKGNDIYYFQKKPQLIKLYPFSKFRYSLAQVYLIYAVEK